MKYVTLILLLTLAGCNNSQRLNPKCLDGFLVYSKEAYMGFCQSVRQSMSGIYGLYCYDGPQQGSRVEADLTLREGFVMRTKCYNILNREKE